MVMVNLWVLLVLVGVAASVTLEGATFVSPMTSVSAGDPNLNWNSTLRLVQVSFRDLCRGEVNVPRNVTSGAVLYVKHTKGDSLLCQMWEVCSVAGRAGFLAVLDGFLEPKPVGVAAAVSYLTPVAPCNLTYLAVQWNSSDPSVPISASDVAFDNVVSPLFAANALNVTIVLGPNSLVGSFFQVWQWTSVAITSLGLIILIVRVVFLLLDLKSALNVPVLACLFAALAFFYQLLRNAVNPSSCYGTVPLWSSELDIFLFTADIPAVLSALTLVAFYQLEVLQPKRLQGPKLDSLKVPAAVAIALLFVLQLVVFVVVATGNDVSNGAIIVQAVVFLIMFVLFLAFFLFVITKLVMAICKSPRKLRKQLTGPLVLASAAVLGSVCAFAAGGIVLADLTYNSAMFVLLEVFSDLSTIFCCFGIAIVIKGTPPRADSGNVIARLTRSLTASMSSPRQKKEPSSGELSSFGGKKEQGSGEQTSLGNKDPGSGEQTLSGRSSSPPTSRVGSEAASTDGSVSDRNSDTVIEF